MGGSTLLSCPMHASHLLLECPPFVGSGLAESENRVSRLSLERDVNHRPRRRERRRAGTWRTAAPPSSNTAYFHATRNGRNLSTLPTCCAVPVCGDNHHLAPSCPPSEQRAGAGATVLARCARHCRTGDVHRPPFTLAAGCCSWLSGRVASSELTERRGPAVIKHKRGHWSTTGPACRFAVRRAMPPPRTPQRPRCPPGGGRGTALCSLSLTAGR